MRPTNLPKSVYLCTHIWPGIHMRGLLSGSVVKNPPANAGDMGLILGSGISPGKESGNPPPVFLPGKFHGHRSLVDYSLLLLLLSCFSRVRLCATP